MTMYDGFEVSFGLGGEVTVRSGAGDEKGIVGEPALQKGFGGGGQHDQKGSGCNELFFLKCSPWIPG